MKLCEEPGGVEAGNSNAAKNGRRFSLVRVEKLPLQLVESEQETTGEELPLNYREEEEDASAGCNQRALPHCHRNPVA